MDNSRLKASNIDLRKKAEHSQTGIESTPTPITQSADGQNAHDVPMAI